MKYGCIGERLGHSFSKEIHNCFADYEYELMEIPKDELDGFMRSRDFKAINVTIPYKEAVIPYLDYIDNAAREIGAVNTIVNIDGKLYGYNTDFYGMSMLIAHAGVDIKGKKVAILGTGGTSKTATAVTRSLSAGEIILVSRAKSADTVTYEELYEYHADIDVIINTTPVGMFPNNFASPVDITKFKELSGIVDVVYNPLRTQLVSEGKRRGISAEGGLYMLVAQAVLASEIFLNKKYESGVLEKVYEKLRGQKENIVLVGMPSSGKSTVGRKIAERMGRSFYDTDEMIEKNHGMKPAEIIISKGEATFRDYESEAINQVSLKTGAVIATGGGAVLRAENVNSMLQNGRIYFLDRPISQLLPTDDRPLTSTKDALIKKFNDRYDVYLRCSDVRIDASGNVDEVSDLIMGDFAK